MDRHRRSSATIFEITIGSLNASASIVQRLHPTPRRRCTYFGTTLCCSSDNPPDACTNLSPARRHRRQLIQWAGHPLARAAMPQTLHRKPDMMDHKVASEVFEPFRSGNHVSQPYYRPFTLQPKSAPGFGRTQANRFFVGGGPLAITTHASPRLSPSFRLPNTRRPVVFRSRTIGGQGTAHESCANTMQTLGKDQRRARFEPLPHPLAIRKLRCLDRFRRMLVKSNEICTIGRMRILSL